MFCKWCGKTIQTTDTNCPNCGRQTPPLSDCGGFYNLKTPNSALPHDIKPTSPVIVNCPVIEKLESKYIRDRKTDKKHHRLTTIFFGIVTILIALSLVLVVRTITKTSSTTDKIFQQIQKDTEDLISDLQQATEPTPNLPTNEIPENTESVDDTCVITVEEETNEQAETVFKIQYQNNIKRFANGKVRYLWQYSTELGDWQDVDEEQFQSYGDDLSVLTCTDEFLEEIGAKEQRIELRCTIQYGNESSDMMEICVHGMFVGKESPDTANDESLNIDPIATNDINNFEE